MSKYEQVIERLREAIVDPDQLVPAFRELTAFVFEEDLEYQQLPEQVQDVLTDLAFDLDYFEPNPIARREDPSFYGPVRARENIKAALARLSRRDAV